MWLSLGWPAHEEKSTSQKMSSSSAFFQICFNCSHAFVLHFFPPRLSFSLSLSLCLRFHPPPNFFSFYLLSVSWLQRSSVYVWKLQEGAVWRPGRKNKVTVEKWGKNELIKSLLCCCWRLLFITFFVFFCLLCKIEVVTFYRFTCCLI